MRIPLGELTRDACPGLDSDGDGTVSVAELMGAVSNALNGCV
jgi:hypothetical protein